MDIFICARVSFFFNVCIYMYVRLNAQSLITSSQVYIYTVFFLKRIMPLLNLRISISRSLTRVCRIPSSQEEIPPDLPLLTHVYIYIQKYRRVCRAQLRQCFDESVSENL